MTPNLAAIEARFKDSILTQRDIALLLTLVRQQQAVIEAAQRIKKTVCCKPGMKDPFDDNWKWFYRLQESLTHLAQG